MGPDRYVCPLRCATVAGIYIHIPFCDHKCIYCDFYSIESSEKTGQFLAMLDREMDLYRRLGHGQKIDTIYFGGGTPSLLSPDQVEHILDRLHSIFMVDGDAEVTLETNPGTVNEDKLAMFRSLGVNRLSIGIQSFHEDDLKFLTRIHSSREAKECVEAARAVGFGNVGIDLIYALPNQTLEQWEDNLHQGVALQPNHISAYSLIVERGTPLWRMVEAKEVPAAKTEIEASMYRTTMEFLRDAGFEHYEVSNYALPGFRSRHNSSYWDHTPYLGFGPSAHSFWQNRRWWNIANLNSYCQMLEKKEVPVAGEEHLSSNQLLEETVMLGLRSDGIDLEELKQCHQIDAISLLSPEVEQLSRDRLLVFDPPLLRLTDDGYVFCDELTKIILAKLP